MTQNGQIIYLDNLLMIYMKIHICPSLLDISLSEIVMQKFNKLLIGHVRLYFQSLLKQIRSHSKMVSLGEKEVITQISVKKEQWGEGVSTKSEFTTHTKYVKCALSGLRRFMAIKSPLEMMKNAFYFTS